MVHMEESSTKYWYIMKVYLSEYESYIHIFVLATHFRDCVIILPSLLALLKQYKFERPNINPHVFLLYDIYWLQPFLYYTMVLVPMRNTFCSKTVVPSIY